MDTENPAEKLKIFCPTHQSVFEVEAAPKIICEIKEHALSNDFPNAEFWEYCCDCQTFSPSNLEVGGKAKTACLQCERPTESRFVCGICKIVSYDSGEDTKGKIFTVNFDKKTVEPSCAGCLTYFSSDKLQFHKCEEIEIVFLTSRQTCPFCKKITVKTKPQPKIKAPPVIKCPKCRTNNEQDSFFCNNCGEQLRSNPQLAKRGTLTAKTQLLYSICPNCGTGNRPDAVYCANCGQALKAAITKPQQNVSPPIPQIMNRSTNSNFVKPATATPKGASQGLTAVGVILGLVAACCVCANWQSKKNNSDNFYPMTNTTFSNPTNTVNISNSNKANSYNSNTSNTVNANKPVSVTPKKLNSNMTNKSNLSNSNISNMSDSNISGVSNSNLTKMDNSIKYSANNSNVSRMNTRPRMSNEQE